MAPTPVDVIALYEKIIRLHPQLWQVAQLALRARQIVKYPLKDYADFLVLADKPGKDVWTVDRARVTLALAKRHFPASLFPIEDEDDLIGKVLVTLIAGARAHALEDELAPRTRTRKQLRGARLQSAKEVRNAR